MPGEATVAGSAAETAETAGAAAAVEHCNEVHLVGRLAAEPVRRELPSGDVLVQFRVVVDRGPSLRGTAGRRTPTIDTLDCTAWRKDVQRSLGSYVAGDVIEVTGALRRRFWRSPGGPASRSEVEATRLRRLLRAGRQ
jgi:single-strand DNA-binding protein